MGRSLRLPGRVYGFAREFHFFERRALPQVRSSHRETVVRIGRALSSERRRAIFAHLRGVGQASPRSVAETLSMRLRAVSQQFGLLAVQQMIVPVEITAPVRILPRVLAVEREWRVSPEFERVLASYDDHAALARALGHEFRVDVLALLLALDVANSKQVAEALHASPERVDRQLRYLRSQGMVALVETPKAAEPRWELTAGCRSVLGALDDYLMLIRRLEAENERGNGHAVERQTD